MRDAVDGRFGDADDDDDEDDAAGCPLAPPPSVKEFRAFSFHLLKPRFSSFPLHDFSFGDGWSIFMIVGYRGNSLWRRRKAVEM